MCRDFEAGSDRCHALRRAVGVEPFLTLEEMAEAKEKLDAKPSKSNPANIIRNAEIRSDDETGRHTIIALMRHGTLKEIHSYDPANETYFQFEFDGLSLDSARKIIDSRTS
jgi:hypothetical protein